MQDFLTEEEAKKKLCPLKLGQSDFTEGLCVGTQCMGWRNGHVFAGDGTTPRGFCGMAAIPKYV